MKKKGEHSEHLICNTQHSILFKRINFGEPKIIDKKIYFCQMLQ
ncbi:Uncharacterized protein dnm_030140 [Desulfonema magnum]|uniref:Uncharacterized protein n=1 Tax=Desulfonema magnum TaxID=45655 RepID=A0A975BKJ3_9BACT|nr:Uncharacterized protein dnm_030140 [Desulfonema magnum]